MSWTLNICIDMGHGIICSEKTHIYFKGGVLVGF